MHMNDFYQAINIQICIVFEHQLLDPKVTNTTQTNDPETQDFCFLFLFCMFV